MIQIPKYRSWVAFEVPQIIQNIIMGLAGMTQDLWETLAFWAFSSWKLGSCGVWSSTGCLCLGNGSRPGAWLFFSQEPVTRKICANSTAQSLKLFAVHFLQREGKEIFMALVFWFYFQGIKKKKIWSRSLSWTTLCPAVFRVRLQK